VEKNLSSKRKGVFLMVGEKTMVVSAEGNR